MPAPDLPTHEQRLEACLIELERLYEARPRMSDALARAGAGQRIDELLDEIAELQQEVMLSPAETLKDAAVKLRRLSVCIDSGRPARLPEQFGPCDLACPATAATLSVRPRSAL